VTLIQILNEVGCRANRSYPYLNNGGCCVYAVLIAKELKKLGMRPRIIVAGESSKSKCNINEARKNIKDIADYNEWSRNGIKFNHVGVEFTYKRKKYHYDSYGVHPACDTLMGFPVYKGRLRIKWAEGIANRPEAWSGMFDRAVIPRLQRSIENSFNPHSWLHKRMLLRYHLLRLTHTLNNVTL
jgi:hypothetical protein